MGIGHQNYMYFFKETDNRCVTLSFLKVINSVARKVCRLQNTLVLLLFSPTLFRFSCRLVSLGLNDLVMVILVELGPTSFWFASFNLLRC